jgi:hypothetical protein
MTDQHPQPQYYLITRDELDIIKNDCYHPDWEKCDNCEYCDPNSDLVCILKCANELMDEVLTSPSRSEQEIRKDERAKVLSEMFEKYMEKRTTPDYHVLLASDFEDIIDELSEQGERE